MSNTEKSLKAQNFKLLCGVVAFDVIALTLIVFPGLIKLDTEHIDGLKFISSAVVPIIVLFLASLLPSDIKDVLVFWRLSHVQPGHRAFSVYASKDRRFTVETLKKKVGEFPTTPEEQNAKWFELYKQAKDDPAVTQAHKAFLLYRELAAISLLLIPIALIALYILASDIQKVLLVGALFLVQYLITAISARNEGIGFVKNVLALHAAKK